MASRARLDKYTDSLETLLKYEQGRKLFREFMNTEVMERGIRILDFWEIAENTKDGSVSIIRVLLEYAHEIELDAHFLNYLRNVAGNPASRDQVNKALDMFKEECVRRLTREYDAFREVYVPQ